MEQDGHISVIRDIIRDLLKIKDDIIEYLTSQNLDDSTRKMWISDAKEFYYNCFASYQILLGNSKAEYKEASKRFCEIAKSRFGQCSSELETFRGDARSTELDSRMKNSFEKFSAAIDAELGEPNQKPVPSSGSAIVRKGEQEYELICSVCGKTATVFKIGAPMLASSKQEQSLRYDGITKSMNLDLSLAEPIFELLQREKISEVHSLLVDKIVGGLDAYCPQCDKIYCREDYDVEEEWDEGFYDDSYGTCPEGHRRLIDD